MKNHLSLLILIMLALFVAVGCSDDGDSPTATVEPNPTAALHAIVCIADHESDIGVSTISDLNSISDWLDQISRNTGMALNTITLRGTGRNLSQNSLLSAIAGLPVGSNDVIIFYYSGHGGANETAGGSKWPLMLFQDEELIDYAVISEQVKAKGARFVVTIADCCNNYSYQAKSMPVVTKGSANSFQNLFLQQQGHIVVSAGSKGEFSLGANDGGMFTNQFLSTFYSNVETDNPGWTTIMQQTSKSIGAYDETGTMTTFHPQYDMNVSPL